MTKTFFTSLILFSALGLSQPALAACGDDEPVITMHFLVGAFADQDVGRAALNAHPIQRRAIRVADGEECEDARADAPTCVAPCAVASLEDPNRLGRRFTGLRDSTAS